MDHLRANGFTVQAEHPKDVAAVKRRHGVPRSLDSCHTGIVDGYVIEGHVPAATIKRVLKERPAFAGVAVPGMPAGSPGMEVPGRPAERYRVMAFDKSGKATVYEAH